MKLWLTRKFALDFKKHGDEQRRWPGYLFGGRVRTSTVVLVVVFLAAWWVEANYHGVETGTPAKTPTSTVGVPPILDPNFTLVPRSVVPQPSEITTTTPTSETTETTTTTEPPPPFPPPFVLPPPFGPGTTPPAPSTPEPGPGPGPTTSAPAS